MAVPDYRLRLFLSADIAGSTAFKAAQEASHDAKQQPRPNWVDVFRQFYADFPKMVQNEYSDLLTDGCGEQAANIKPKIWKTIGDEVILCCRSFNIEHTSVIVNAFLVALQKYGPVLQKHSNMLDLKGNLWIAAFPVPNVSIPLEQNLQTDNGTDTSERIEGDVDKRPAGFDFLGKGMDTGFRISQFSSPSRCSMSLQLALLLAEAKRKNLFPYDIWFAGRFAMKGVNAEIPYPIFYIDTERDAEKSLFNAKERLLKSESHLAPETMLEFIEQFMKIADIEQPYISMANETPHGDKPESYRSFVEAFNRSVKEGEEKLKALKQSEEDGSNLSDSDPELKAKIKKVHAQLLKNLKS